MRILTVPLVLLLSSCVSLMAKKHTYGGSTGVEVNGARVGMQVKPEGTENGSYMLSAMVVSAGVATLDGPFRWRFEATGEEGRQEWMTVTRIRTRTGLTHRDEWFPRELIGKRADFRRIKGEPGRTRARYEIPGQLKVKPREDGPLTVWAEIAVGGGGRVERKLLKFKLDPAEKRQDEFVFLPAEIVRSVGTDPKDWNDPSWD